MTNLIAIVIILMVLLLLQSRAELTRERKNSDTWRESALMLNRELLQQKVLFAQITDNDDTLEDLIRGEL